MVRILIGVVFLFTVGYALGQVSVYYDITQNKFTEKNDYYQEGSNLWVGIGVNGVVLNETNLIDTVKLFSSFGCTQYHLSDTSLTLYLWLDYYYGSDCLCTENDDFCKPDTSSCDLKIRFYSTKKGLSCYIGKITLRNINIEKMSSLSNYICSEDYLKLTNEINDLGNIKYKKTKDFTYSNLDSYLELLIYLIEKSDTKCCLKFSENVKYVLEKEITQKNDEYLYYEKYYKYSDLIIKYLFPIQGKSYSGNKLKREMKRISLLSKREVHIPHIP
jgi:hypothetical protein